MGLLNRLRDLDARGGSILPGSDESRTAYLERLATSNRGSLLGSALGVFARELLEQRRSIADLRVRLDALEQRE